MRKYSKKGTIAFHTTEIAKLMDDGKFEVARIKINELKDDYSMDYGLKLNLARLNVLEKRYEDALDILEEIDEDYVFMKKLALYIKLGYEEKMLRIYNKYFVTDSKYFENFKYNEQYLGFYIFLCKKYNNKLELCVDVEELSYTNRQLYSYDKVKALKHIKNNHKYNISDKGIFFDDIDIDNLYEEISDYINKNDCGRLSQNLIEVYNFYYPNCGYNVSSGNCNCIYVCTFVGCRDILTMYPVPGIKSRDYLYLDNNHNDVKKKVRVKNGLERFNSRYNK